MKGLYPKEYVNSTYEIDFETLYEKGYRGVIFDIDNTLVPHGAPADDKAIAFFERMRKIGYQTLMLSNNKEPRVKMFCDAVGAPYIYKAGKPSVEGYQKAMEKMGTNVKNTLFVGDQIFTDTLGANLAGAMPILVKPINNHNIWLKLRHIAEKPFIFMAKRRIKQ